MVMSQLIHTIMRAIFYPHEDSFFFFHTHNFLQAGSTMLVCPGNLLYVTVPVLRDKLKLILPVTLNQAQSPIHKYGH